MRISVNNSSGHSVGSSFCFLVKAALSLLTLSIMPNRIALALSPQERTTPYSLSVSVNEVGIHFHASDAHNLSVVDLKPEEVNIFDNDTGPGQVVSLKHLDARPIHISVVMDTSGSVRGQLARSRAEAQEAVQKLLVHSGDEGTAVEFGRSRRLVQAWTSQKSVLMDGINHVGRGSRDPIDGTSVFDALFSTCFYEFGKVSATEAANAIVLFTDGEDTASSVSLASAADKCLQNHVAIYAFSPKPSPETTSLGPATLRQLTEQTGGRLFYVDDPDGDIHADIDTVGNDLRDEYFLIYRPRHLKHDGAFHKIVLIGPNRVSIIVGTSGFYAPVH